MENNVISIFIPTKPCPASRPRVSTFGAYYSKNYMNYRRDTHIFLKTIRDQYPIDEDSLFEVDVEFICKKPARPANPKCPFGDIDNYIKSPLDAITYSKMIWNDDVQILKVTGTKRYQEDGEDYGTKITITKV